MAKHILSTVSRKGKGLVIHVPKEYKGQLNYRDIVLIVPVDNVLNGIEDRIRQRYKKEPQK